MDENNNQKQGFPIELNAETALGEYANLALISHSSSDFVIDFARMLPGMPKPQVRSRVVLAPSVRFRYPTSRDAPSLRSTAVQARRELTCFSERDMAGMRLIIPAFFIRFTFSLSRFFYFCCFMLL